MENRFDELAKAIAGGMTRRQALRTLGGGLVAALLAPFGLGKPAWGQAPNSQCEKFCRDTCGVSPGGGNAFGKCVSSCERCLNAGDIVVACPPGGGETSVVCQGCDVEDPCFGQFACPGVDRFCTEIPVCGSNACFCHEPSSCSDLPACTSNADCPAGWACAASCCSDGPDDCFCHPPCGTQAGTGVAGGKRSTG